MPLRRSSRVQCEGGRVNESPEQLRQMINNLKSEIAAIDRKHSGTALALSVRRQKLSRLEAALAMSAAPALSANACP